PRTRVIGAEGNWVLPGFTDSHLHLTVAMKRTRGRSVSEVTTPAGFERELKDLSKARPDQDVLYLFDLNYLRPPIIPAEECRSFLDRIVDDRPVIVFAHDLHTLWANSAALETAGLLHEMPPYPPLADELALENNIVLGADRIPSGELREPEVGYFVTGPVQARFPVPIEKQLDELENVCRDLATHGITGVHNMGLAQPAEDLSFLILLLELEQKGRLPVRVSTSFSAIADANMLEDVHQAYLARNALRSARNKEMNAAELHDLLLEKLLGKANSRHPDLVETAEKDSEIGGHPHIAEILSHSRHIHKVIEKTYLKPHGTRDNPHRKQGMPEYIGEGCKVRCDTVKIFMDGIVEKNTAYRLDREPVMGIPEFSEEELFSLVEFADKLGMQVAAHSIGDASVRSMLNAILRVRRLHDDMDEERGHKIPHRVEHIELCEPGDIPRFGEESVVTSMQPLHERPPVRLWHKMVPENKWDTAFAWEDVQKNGAVLVFGSDWPIVSCDVREGIQHAVTRTPWVRGSLDQSVSLDEAVNAYTSGPAFTEYSDRIKGRVQPGMLADMVIISGDLKALQRKDGSKPDIHMTICDGRIIHAPAD
ncbi:MAG: amidohydrolase family protein, partial [Candidatus Omnitrophica bacterium]|nr:amidohydrolase family protein [Candidatus Omnitrophota bacterium]